MKPVFFSLCIVLFFIACEKGIENPHATPIPSSTNGNGDRSSAETEAEDSNDEWRTEIRLDSDPCPLGFVWHPVAECYYQAFDICIQNYGNCGLFIHKCEMTFHLIGDDIPNGAMRTWRWFDLTVYNRSEIRIPGEYFLYQRFDRIIVTLTATDEFNRPVNSQWTIYSWYTNPVCYYSNL